jgi:hypothetical protein
MAPRPIDVGEHRAHQHDLPAAADHGFQRGRHRVDYSSHVDGHDTTHLVGRQCAECAATAENAGVGNCDVDAPELLMGSPHGLLDGIDVDDIAFQRQTVAVW